MLIREFSLYTTQVLDLIMLKMPHSSVYAMLVHHTYRSAKETERCLRLHGLLFPFLSELGELVGCCSIRSTVVDCKMVSTVQCVHLLSR